jgi:hypothetical protein
MSIRRARADLNQATNALSSKAWAVCGLRILLKRRWLAPPRRRFAKVWVVLSPSPRYPGALFHHKPHHCDFVR